jgi:hypothetical protein
MVIAIPKDQSITECQNACNDQKYTNIAGPYSRPCDAGCALLASPPEWFDFDSPDTDFMLSGFFDELVNDEMIFHEYFEGFYTTRNPEGGDCNCSAWYITKTSSQGSWRGIGYGVSCIQNPGDYPMTWTSGFGSGTVTYCGSIIAGPFENQWSAQQAYDAGGYADMGWSVYGWNWENDAQKAEYCAQISECGIEDIVCEME